jgi:DNA-binding CsgD family transcriptional regulator
LPAVHTKSVHAFPGDHHSLIRRHEEGNDVEFRLPGAGPLGADHPLPRLFAELWAEEDPLGTHPSVAAFLKHGPGAYLRSQLEPDESWRQRAHYLTVDKPQGIEDMLSIFLEPWKGTLVTMHAGSFSGPMDAKLLGPAREFASVANSLLLARGGLARGSGRPAADLSGREAEVMGWVSKGKRNSEIGEILHLSVHTVRKHLENCFAKLGVETRTAAVVEFEKAKRAGGWGRAGQG